MFLFWSWALVPVRGAACTGVKLPIRQDGSSAAPTCHQSQCAACSYRLCALYYQSADLFEALVLVLLATENIEFWSSYTLDGFDENHLSALGQRPATLSISVCHGDYRWHLPCSALAIYVFIYLIFSCLQNNLWVSSLGFLLPMGGSHFLRVFPLRPMR